MLQAPTFLEMLVILHLSIFISLSSTVCRIFVSWYLCIYTSKWAHSFHHCMLYLCIFVSSHLQKKRHACLLCIFVSSYLGIYTSKWLHGDSHSTMVCCILVSSYLHIKIVTWGQPFLPGMSYLCILVSSHLQKKRHACLLCILSLIHI